MKATARDIQVAVCNIRNIPLRRMLDRDREWRVAHPRFEAMYLIRKIRGLSLNQTARLFKKWEHTLCLHGVRRVAEWIEVDPDYGAEISALHDRLACEHYREGLAASEAVGAFLRGLYPCFYTDDGWRRQAEKLPRWDRPRAAQGAPG